MAEKFNKSDFKSYCIEQDTVTVRELMITVAGFTNGLNVSLFSKLPLSVMSI